VRLIGRDRELVVIAAALSAACDESTMLTIEAEAGAGKSAILDAAITHALSDGTQVLRCRPTTTESQLAYVALGDLLDPVRDLSSVDPVPRQALEHALLRSDVSSRAGKGMSKGNVDTRSVGGACASIWRALSNDRTLLIAIDDVQWLDAASAAALAFSFRRLPERGVLVLCARRLGEPSIDVTGATMPVAPLSAEAVTMILAERDRAKRPPLSGRQLRNIVDISAGNPLFAIELARAAERSPRTDGQVAVPHSLDDALHRRFGSVGTTMSEALATVALLGRPDIAMMRSLGVLDVIEQAERDGLVDTSTGRIVFVHPLFAAAILDRTTASKRRYIHRRLASIVDDSTESARHAAHAAEQPDGMLAARLAALADDLVGRAAVDQAADFAVLAAALTPANDPERPARYASAGCLSFQRGESAAALALLDQIDRSVASPAVLMREQLVRCTVVFSAGGSGTARSHAENALQHCRTDAERVEVHSTLSRVYYDHFPTAAEHARIAYDLAERTDVPPAVRASALVANAGTRFMSGEGLDRAMLARAIEMERDLPVFAADSAYASFAALLKMVDEHDEARAMFLALLSSTEDDGALPYSLSHLPQLELWTGNWDAAEDYAARHLEAALRTGQHDQVTQATNNLSLINLYRGDVDDAAALAQELIETARATGDLWTERNGLGQLGLVSLANGDAEAAVRLLSRWHDLGEEMGLREPGYCRLRADYVEALVATGRIDVADDYAQMMQREAERLDRPTLLAGGCRVRSLVAAARGERVIAVALATEAVARFEATPLVVDHARALLTLGQIHRRFKEKAAARTALQAALDVFDRLGAERFAERARQDLSRIGLRPPASTGLTETERRVAELAATGRTVRQVGDELFISPKTVEANLTRVYRKLGISGRAELATWSSAQERGALTAV